MADPLAPGDDAEASIAAHRVPDLGADFDDSTSSADAGAGATRTDVAGSQVGVQGEVAFADAITGGGRG